jgi:AAA+ superfamily predicted ATPase
MQKKISSPKLPVRIAVPPTPISKNKKSTPLDAINTIYFASKESSLPDELIPSLKKELNILSKYLSCSEIEAFLFANIATLNLFGDKSDMVDLYRFFEITPFQFIPLVPALDSLYEKRLIFKKTHRHRSDDVMRKYYFSAAPDIIDALIRNAPFPKSEKREMNGTIEVLEVIYELANSCIQGELNVTDMMTEVEQLLNSQKKHAFIRTVRDLDLLDKERVLYIYVIWKTLMGTAAVDMDDPITAFYPISSQRVRYIQSIYSGESKLISNELLEYRQSRFFNDVELQVTEKTSDLLQEDQIVIFKQKKKSNTIKPETIGLKTLYFSEREEAQISTVREMMMENTYKELIERLKGKNLPLNLNILLFGAPGTGKTETVLQLAKSSGREIMKVEISQTKSMWFGESEKNIKKIFKEYEELCKNCDLTPILFFNEADAILSNRKSGSNSNTAQTENAIQNILLEELENFKGIFLATTNLADNLDKAFDRRFLFKIKFEKPELAARTAIWMDKINDLSMEDASYLADNFDLTGGQIDNIVRKCEIKSVIEGADADFEMLKNYCIEELVLSSKSGNFIGFQKRA